MMAVAGGALPHEAAAQPRAPLGGRFAERQRSAAGRLAPGRGSGSSGAFGQGQGLPVPPGRTGVFVLARAPGAGERGAFAEGSQITV